MDSVSVLYQLAQTLGLEACRGVAVCAEEIIFDSISCAVRGNMKPKHELAHSIDGKIAPDLQEEPNSSTDIYPLND